MTGQPDLTEPTRILITGANGFVGRHLIQRLLTEFAPGALQIVAGVRPDHVEETRHPSHPLPDSVGWTGCEEHPDIEVVPIDVTNAATTTELVAALRPRQIVHLAGLASGAGTDRDAIFAVNVEGTRNLLEAAARLSFFPRVLLASTSYVYGTTQSDRPAREEDPIGPLWRYGAYADSKMEMETMARAYRALAIIARPFSHTGPGQSPAFAIPAFARQLARIEKGLDPPRLLVGNLDAFRDYLDVRDVVRAYILLLQHGQTGEAYNIATGRPIQMRAVLDTLRGLCTVPVAVETDPARLRPADIAFSSGDATRLRNLTDWEPEFSFKQTLQDVLNYWRSAT